MNQVRHFTGAGNVAPQADDNAADPGPMLQGGEWVTTEAAIARSGWRVSHAVEVRAGIEPTFADLQSQFLSGSSAKSGEESPIRALFLLQKYGDDAPCGGSHMKRCEVSVGPQGVRRNSRILGHWPVASGKFTLTYVQDLACPAGRKDMLVFEPATRGFGLRVGEKGAKTFVAQYTADGIKRRVPLGSFGVLTIEQARTAALKVLRAAAGGADPVAEKREREVAKAAAKVAAEFTFSRLVEKWAEAREGERRDSYIKEAKACLARNFEAWKDRPAASITMAEAIEALDQLKRAKSTVAANRSLAYARAAFSWACARQQLATNPFKGIEQPGREISRDRVLSPDELRAIWSACDSLTSIPAGFVRMLMLTLGRREEVASMTWAELDDPDMPTKWTLPRERAKNGRAHVVHLSEPAKAVLASMPRMMGNPYVFAGRCEKAVAAFSLMKAALDEALAKALGKPLPGWRFHDFRRSGVTYLATNGVAPHIADRLLNHVSGTIQGVAAVYQRAEFAAERAAALDMWGQAIARLTTAGEP